MMLLIAVEPMWMFLIAVITLSYVVNCSRTKFVAINVNLSFFANICLTIFSEYFLLSSVFKLDFFFLPDLSYPDPEICLLLT